VTSKLLVVGSKTAGMDKLEPDERLTEHVVYIGV
jgi:hypothetical protein